MAVFDCCHSGGLTPPDDIRHRALRWVAEEQMWVARDFPTVSRSLADKKDGHHYLGINGATNRLGRAARLRTMPNAEYDATRKALGHHGPYLPILLEACQQQQFSYEYRHGATSYGAYTFCLAQVLRACRADGVNPSFVELNAQVMEKLHRLTYNQTPMLVGAKKCVARQVPWTAAVKPLKKKKAVKLRRK